MMKVTQYLISCAPEGEFTEELMELEVDESTMPEEPEPEGIPTAQDDTDAMLVDHEYRITLLELGV